MIPSGINYDIWNKNWLNHSKSENIIKQKTFILSNPILLKEECKEWSNGGRSPRPYLIWCKQRLSKCFSDCVSCRLCYFKHPPIVRAMKRRAIFNATWKELSVRRRRPITSYTECLKGRCISPVLQFMNKT